MMLLSRLSGSPTSRFAQGLRSVLPYPILQSRLRRMEFVSSLIAIGWRFCASRHQHRSASVGMNSDLRFRVFRMPVTVLRRRVVIFLIASPFALVAVRGYVELLRQNSQTLAAWFSRHPLRIGLPIAAALLASSLAAYYVRRTRGRGLVVPVAMLAGALAAAPYNSLVGMTTGGAIGLGFTLSWLRQLIIESLKLSVSHVVPTVVIAGSVACVSRMSLYADWTGRSVVATILLTAGIPLSLWISWRGVGRCCASGGRRSLSPSGAATASHPPWWRRYTHAASAGMLVAISLWIGWQSDIYRRVWLLNGVGYIYWQEAKPDQWLTHGPWVPIEVSLNRSTQGRHLKLLRGLPGIKSLAFFEANLLEDADYRHLEALTELTSLHFYQLPITDEGFRHVTLLKKLHSIYIDDTRLTRRSLDMLGNLPVLNHASIEA